MTPDRGCQDERRDREDWQLNDGDVAPPCGRIPIRGVTIPSSHRSFGKAGMLTVQDVPESNRAISRSLHHPPGRVHRGHLGDRPPRGRLSFMSKFRHSLYRDGTR